MQLHRKFTILAITAAACVPLSRSKQAQKGSNANQGSAELSCKHHPGALKKDLLTDIKGTYKRLREQDAPTLQKYGSAWCHSFRAIAPRFKEQPKRWKRRLEQLESAAAELKRLGPINSNNGTELLNSEPLKKFWNLTFAKRFREVPDSLKTAIASDLEDFIQMLNSPRQSAL